MNPSLEASPELTLTSRVKGFLKDRARDVMDDIQAREYWADYQDYFERRRFCQEFRNPTFPWPGSSDIVMPLIDKTIKKASPRFFETILGDRPINADAIDRDSQERNWQVELFMKHLLHSKETRSLQQIAYHVDDFHQHGWAPLKSMWVYKKGPTPIHLRRDKLPDELRKLVPVKDEKTASFLALQAEQQGQQLAVLTFKELSERREPVTAMIAGAYGLDETDDDRKVAREIFEWFLSGAKESKTIMGRGTFVNQPGLVAVSPYDCIFPQNTTDIQEAERITHRMRIGTLELLRLARSGDWNLALLNDIIKSSKENGGSDSRERATDLRTQSERDRYHLSSDGEHDEHELLEVFTWFSEKEFGEQKKISYIVHKARPDEPLKIRVWNRESGRFPWHITKLESSCRRIMGSRGIPEMLNDIDAEVTLNHRNKQNRATVSTAPSFAYRPGSGFNPENVRWIPGGMYPTQRPGQDVVPLTVPPMDAYEDREEAILRTWAEEFTGASDFGLTNPLSNLNEARTAKEITAIQSSSSMTALISGSDFSETIAEIADEFFDMYHSYGPEELWIARTGSRPMKLAKADLRGNFTFSMSAGINSGGPAGQAQRALERLMITLQGQLQQQIGVKYELDVGEMIRDWLERSDPRAAARVLRERTPEEIQKIQAQQQQQAELQRKAMLNEDMTPEEMAEFVSQAKGQMPHKGNQKVDISGIMGG